MLRIYLQNDVHVSCVFLAENQGFEGLQCDPGGVTRAGVFHVRGVLFRAAGPLAPPDCGAQQIARHPLRATPPQPRILIDFA